MVDINRGGDLGFYKKFPNANIYIFAFIAIFAMVLIPIYSNSYSNVGRLFAPLNVVVATSDPRFCGDYALKATGGLKNVQYQSKTDGDIDFFAFRGGEMCAMARNSIEQGVASLMLKVNDKAALDALKFINISMLSHNFYIPKNEIADKIKQNGERFFIDLSNYKINENGKFLNSYGNFFIAILLYFLAPPFSFVWLFVLLFLVPQNIDKFIIRHHKILLFFIILFGFILRLNNFNEFSIWGDELYTININSHPDNGFLAVFADPGNPPFFNFILKIWLLIFDLSPQSARILPTIIGTIAIFSIFIFLKNHASNDRDKNILIALTAAFLTAISAALITISNEVRGYILEFALIPLVLNFLFNLFKSFNAKDAIFYFIFSSMLANTHYFGAIFIFCSFILAIFYFKNFKKIIALLLLNIAVVATLLPHMIITAFKRGLMDESFNTWIKTPTINEIFVMVPKMFGEDTLCFLAIFLLFLGFFVKNRVVKFCIFLAILMVIVPFLFSYFRPIFTKRYAIVAIYPLVLAILCAVAFLYPWPKTLPKRAFIAFCLAGFLAFSNTELKISLSPTLNDNSKAVFNFITSDSKGENNAFIVHANYIMAHKSYQYALYNLAPNAKFINLSDIEFGPNLKGVFYFDGYYFLLTNEVEDAIKKLENLGGKVIAIPFEKRYHRHLNEEWYVAYKVILE